MTRGLRSALLLCVCVCISGLGFCQQKMTTITAAKIGDASGVPLAKGLQVWTPTYCAGTPQQFHVGGGGWATSEPVKCNVVNGVITTNVKGGTCRVADSKETQPANLCYEVQIKDTVNTKNTFPIVKNVQPTGSSWSWDDYIPTNVPNALQTSGPKGDRGDPGLPYDPNCHTDGNGKLICGSVAADTTIAKKLQQAVYCAARPDVYCDGGIHMDTAGLQACLSQGNASTMVVVPQTTWNVTGNGCAIDATLTAPPGTYIKCLAPAKFGGSGCVIEWFGDANDGPMLKGGTGTVVDGPYFVGDGVQQLATVDAVQLDADATGNLDSHVINSNFYKTRWATVINGRNFDFIGNVGSSGYGAVKLNFTGSGGYVYGTLSDLHSYHFKDNIFEGMGGSCSSGMAPGLFTLPTNAPLGVVRDTELTNNKVNDGWFAPLLSGSNLTMTNSAGNTVNNGMGGLFNLGGTNYTFSSVNDMFQGQSWTFGGCHSSVAMAGMELGTVNGANITNAHIVNVGKQAIDVTGPSIVNVFGGTYVNVSQSASNTYSAISVAGGSQGGIYFPSVSTDGGKPLPNYAINAGISPYFHVFLGSVNGGVGTSSLSSGAGNGSDNLPTTTGGSYTPVCTNVTTAGTVALTGYYRQTGNTVSVQIKWTLAAGAGNTIAYTANSSYCTLPAGLSTSYSQPAKLTTGSGYAFAEAIFNTGYITVLQSSSGTGTQAAEWILGGTYMLQ